MSSLLIYMCIWCFDNRDPSDAANQTPPRCITVPVVQNHYAAPKWLGGKRLPHERTRGPTQFVLSVDSGTRYAHLWNPYRREKKYKSESHSRPARSSHYDRRYQTEFVAGDQISNIFELTTTCHELPSCARREWMPPIALPFSQLQSGLAILLEALDWASPSGIDPWDFAVEIRRLHQAGLSDTHLRWLIAGGYVEHAFEYTLPGDQKRSFRPLKTPNFRKRSCFVLSNAGAEFARPICQKSVEETPAETGPGESATRDVRTEKAVQPRWDAERRQLTVGDDVVKRFKGRVGNQERVLAAFEEESWPPRVFDPLPAINRGKTKGRLHDTVKAPNHRQIVQRIRFFRDGSGERICWELQLPCLS